jgi:hypothetical protein
MCKAPGFDPQHRKKEKRKEGREKEEREEGRKEGRKERKITEISFHNHHNGLLI